MPHRPLLVPSSAHTEVAAARLVAADVHAARRYGDAPYTVHLAAVEAALREVGVDEANGPDDVALLVAAQLHDAPEDAGVSIASIQAAFGDRAAALVRAVTNGPGQTRWERFAAVVPLLRATPRAPTLKLADRLAHARAARAPNASRFFRMYAREQPALRAAVQDVLDAQGHALLAAIEPLLVHPPVRTTAGWD